MPEPTDFDSWFYSSTQYFDSWFYSNTQTTRTPLSELQTPIHDRICHLETLKEPQELKYPSCRGIGKIHIMKQYLANMTPPIQNPPQAYEYAEYIRRIKNLTLEASTDILDIEANTFLFEICPKELQNFKTSLYNIERETSAVYSDLCTWKASHTRPPAGASKERAAAVETKHTTLAQSPEPDQDGDTKGFKYGR